jgi:hypothetical protein
MKKYAAAATHIFIFIRKVYNKKSPFCYSTLRTIFPATEHICDVITFSDQSLNVFQNVTNRVLCGFLGSGKLKVKVQFTL